MNDELENNDFLDRELLNDIKALIEETKLNIALNINISTNIFAWKTGKRIKEEFLKSKKPEYNKNVINNLSKELTSIYGKGYSKTNLFNFLKVYEIFPTIEIFHTVSGKLSWSHLRHLIYIEDNLKREFYIEMSKLENWSTRTLQDRIKSMLYERTAISKKPEETIKGDLSLLKNEKKISPDLVFRDPYFLDFLGLSDTYSEKDLESAILVELQKFIIEMGNDFAFMARQKRLTIDHRDYYIDLLFFHRRLKCLIAIDLKLGEFEASYKGQMELYLRYLEKYEVLEGENTPIGLILCTGKNEEHIELMQLDKSNIKVAEYITKLPSNEYLKEKLHRAIEIAKNKLNN